MLTEAQKRANANWVAKNKEKKKKLDYNSRARVFISKMADEEELEELEKLIALRRIELKSNNT